MVSAVFCPVRPMSLWEVTTLVWARKPRARRRVRSVETNVAVSIAREKISVKFPGRDRRGMVQREFRAKDVAGYFILVSTLAVAQKHRATPIIFMSAWVFPYRAYWGGAAAANIMWGTSNDAGKSIQMIHF